MEHVPGHSTIGIKSFADVLRGHPEGQQSHLSDDVVVLDGLEESGWRSNALIGRVKDFDYIPNLYGLSKGEGFLDLKFSYLGGFFVLIDCPSAVVKDKFLNHSGVISWFSDIMPWSPTFVLPERIVWLEIEGVPIDAWDRLMLSKVVAKWGMLTFMDMAEDGNLFYGKIGVLTSCMSLIFDTIKVQAYGFTHQVRIMEVCHRFPGFLNVDVEIDNKFKDVGDKSRDEVETPIMEDRTIDNGLDEDRKVGGSNCDPFRLNDSIIKTSKDVEEGTDVTPDCPPGFTPPHVVDDPNEVDVGAMSPAFDYLATPRADHASTVEGAQMQGEISVSETVGDLSSANLKQSPFTVSVDSPKVSTHVVVESLVERSTKFYNLRPRHKLKEPSKMVGGSSCDPSMKANGEKETLNREESIRLVKEKINDIFKRLGQPEFYKD